MPVILQNIVHPVYNARFAQQKTILNIESLKIDDGEFVGVIDATDGCGAFLGKILCGIIKPEYGELSVKLQSEKRVFLDIGCERIVCGKSVEKEIISLLNRRNVKTDEGILAAKEALELLGYDYDKIRTRSPFELSVGDRRNVVLASSFALHPGIIVLNEPMRDMDGVWCANLLKLLERMKRDGTTVFLISSDTSRLSQTADRIIIMKNGEIAADSITKNIFSEYYSLVHLALPVPEVKKCCQMLREKGMNMPNNIILYDQFIDRLKILMWRKEK